MSKARKEQKIKREIPLRPSGEVVNPQNTRPSQILFNEVKRLEDLEAQNNLAFDETIAQTETSSQQANISRSTPARQTSLTSHSSQTRQGKHQPTLIAPTRDYQKVPNSITKKAIPEGLFKPGKSKHLYDVLYSLTRGAIEPARSVRISKTKLMKKAGIGSRITFDSIISQFETIGLIKVTVHAGEHEGNEFEVFTYEEIETLPSQTRQSSQTSPSQNLDGVVSPESSQTSHTLNDENISGSSIRKTLLKTLNFIDDDAPVISALEKLNEAARAATGKDLTRKDWEAFGEIIELVTNETAVARTRTRSVSVYLKFAAENLRRRLYSKKEGAARKNQVDDKKTDWVNIGKDFETYDYDEQGNVIPKPLNDEQRKRALENLMEFRAWNTPIEDSERFYTPEDWKWLMENL